MSKKPKQPTAQPDHRCAQYLPKDSNHWIHFLDSLDRCVKWDGHPGHHLFHSEVASPGVLNIPTDIATVFHASDELLGQFKYVFADVPDHEPDPPKCGATWVPQWPGAVGTHQPCDLLAGHEDPRHQAPDGFMWLDDGYGTPVTSDEAPTDNEILHRIVRDALEWPDVDDQATGVETDHCATLLVGPSEYCVTVVGPFTPRTRPSVDEAVEDVDPVYVYGGVITPSAGGLSLLITHSDTEIEAAVAAGRTWRFDPPVRLKPGDRTEYHIDGDSLRLKVIHPNGVSFHEGEPIDPTPRVTGWSAPPVPPAAVIARDERYPAIPVVTPSSTAPETRYDQSPEL